MACARQGMDWGFWSCFVSALCLTVYLGVPYVLSGAMKASELLDAVFKMRALAAEGGKYWDKKGKLHENKERDAPEPSPGSKWGCARRLSAEAGLQ